VPDQSRTLGADLQVLHELPSPQVVLGGLPPVYARGLQLVLESSVASCTVVGDVGQVPSLLAGPDPFVVVVPESDVPAVLPVPPALARHAVVVLVEQATPESCATAMRAGVTGVIAVDDAPEQVVAVVRGAARGYTVLAREFVQALCRPAAVVPPSLTVVERGWLRRLARGGTVAGLARSCGYSEREMYRRLSDVYLRLGARTRTEALLLAERFGLLDEGT
jgi:DNA-binding CsgD family transcriptional regulator